MRFTYFENPPAKISRGRKLWRWLWRASRLTQIHVDCRWNNALTG